MLHHVLSKTGQILTVHQLTCVELNSMLPILSLSTRLQNDAVHIRTFDPLRRLVRRRGVLFGAACGTALLGGVGQANASSATWSNVHLSQAQYVVTAAKVHGSPSSVSNEQIKSVVRAMKNDAAGALKRRYPKATILNTTTSQAIVVTPALFVPSGLWPWSTVELHMTFRMPTGKQYRLRQKFGVLELWNHSYNAANFAFDELAKRLP